MGIGVLLIIRRSLSLGFSAGVFLFRTLNVSNPNGSWCESLSMEKKFCRRNSDSVDLVMLLGEGGGGWPWSVDGRRTGGLQKGRKICIMAHADAEWPKLPRAPLTRASYWAGQSAYTVSAHLWRWLAMVEGRRTSECRVKLLGRVEASILECASNCHGRRSIV
ncbi:hypothetical protein K505DRAFT_49038 [Melanomma pulvis-pyrius CBS 109.77]|uniref:Uncharacterized protein n=1 Tax=Melanomma pulvis-pyrius CBS 109.77 TaxID=1314802 RepID=A0A6A6X8W2_9PLEO|nr:hypothetical protein K505DRAFT_49038 [Melanomma pulvis-pyrius CBS 109.77]